MTKTKSPHNTLEKKKVIMKKGFITYPIYVIRNILRFTYLVRVDVEIVNCKNKYLQKCVNALKLNRQGCCTGTVNNNEKP